MRPAVWLFLLAAGLSAGRLWSECLTAPEASRWQQSWWLGAAPDASRFPSPQLKIAVEPRRSRAWIDLGLDQENSGDFIGAEASLLQAARVDHQHLPAWTLTNFYLRRDNLEQFWAWAARSAILTPDDMRPLLLLAHRTGGDDPERTIAQLGGGPGVARTYLDYLLGLGRIDLAYRAALVLEARGDPDDNGRVAAAVDRILSAGELEMAVALWNRRFSLLDPRAGPWLVNANLAHRPRESGFEAVLPMCDGVSVTWRPGELRFAFDGTQPDGCVLYDQRLAIDEPRRLAVNAPLEPAIAGLSWTLTKERLQLTYRRPAGYRRARGETILRHIDLEPVTQ